LLWSIVLAVAIPATFHATTSFAFAKPARIQQVRQAAEIPPAANPQPATECEILGAIFGKAEWPHAEKFAYSPDIIFLSLLPPEMPWSRLAKPVGRVGVLIKKKRRDV
jgi:hypothetical protein